MGRTLALLQRICKASNSGYYRSAKKLNILRMDATKRPLMIPPEFATYAEQHGIFDMYKVGFHLTDSSRPNA